MSTEQINLLLVDDRKEDLLSLELILKNENYNFVEATSGREALRILLKKHDFAIILIDVHMPLIDGFETAKLIRESDKLKHIPIIFLTAANDAPANMFKGYLTGAVDYMIKPVMPEIMRAKVSAFADLYKKTKQLEVQHENLLKLNKVYETLLKTESAMGQGVMITEMDKIIYVNEAICKILGYTEEEMLRLSPEILVDDPVWTEKIRQHLKSEQQQSPGEVKVMRKDGKAIDIEYRTCNIDMEGRPQSLFIIRDVTEEKQKEEQLHKEKERAESAEIARRVGEQFLANMSHEIRTPMNAIIGFTNVLLKTAISSEQSQYLEAIKMSGDNLLVIINDILDFSRINSGKIQMEERIFKLSHIVSMCFELMQSKASEKGIKLSTSIARNIHDDLIGDGTRLNQVLLNLMANAIKFTDVGEVSVNAKLLSEVNDEVEIEFMVKDTGIGIPKDKLFTIFEAFTQADNNTARQYGGTGLGLAIVKQLIELQNGSVSVSSEEGKGSCFYFRIKYKKASVFTTKNNAVQKAPERKMEKLNVLLVEDNDMNQLLAHKVLSDWGCGIEMVKNGIEAIDKIKIRDFDIILMDIQMPKMDGYEATRQIRNQLPIPKCNVPIMAMTAHVMPNEEDKCYKAGMNGYISKPFDTATLYSKIATIVGLK